MLIYLAALDTANIFAMPRLTIAPKCFYMLNFSFQRLSFVTYLGFK